MLIDLSLLVAPRQRISVAEAILLPPFGGVTFLAPAIVDLEIERADTTVRVTGTVKVSATAECARCLTDSEIPYLYDVDECFMILGTDPLGEDNVVGDDQLDLQDFVRQIVDSALPLAQLCRDDCAGLCERCGGNHNQGPCACAARAIMKGDHG